MATVMLMIFKCPVLYTVGSILATFDNMISLLFWETRAARAVIKISPILPNYPT